MICYFDQPMQAQDKIHHMGQGVGEIIAANSKLWQQKEQPEYIQKIGQSIDPDAVDLLTEPLVHPIYNAVKVQNGQQRGKQAEIVPGGGIFI